MSGAATTVAQDVFNGKTPSLERAQEAARLGGALGGLGGVAGRVGANRMSNKDKELLGENLSLLRTRMRGDRTSTTKKSRQILPKGGYTYPDQRTAGGQLVESKFGLSADLRPRQRQAYDQLTNYRVDHALPKDVGAFVGLPMAQYGILSDRRDRPLASY